jgi:hypothetical protein
LFEEIAAQQSPVSRRVHFDCFAVHKVSSVFTATQATKMNEYLGTNAKCLITKYLPQRTDELPSANEDLSIGPLMP